MKIANLKLCIHSSMTTASEHRAARQPGLGVTLREDVIADVAAHHTAHSQ